MTVFVDGVLFGVCLLFALVFLGAFVFGGCSPCYDGYHYDGQTFYAVAPDRRTPEGLPVDARDVSSGAFDAASLREIDTRVDEVETCLQAKFPNGLSDEQRTLGVCDGTFSSTVHRSCLKIKVAPDWYLDCPDATGTREQLFPCADAAEGCALKGIASTSACPCGCRGAIQGTDVLVTTPDLRLFEAKLLELMTGCQDVWHNGVASACYHGL